MMNMDTESLKSEMSGRSRRSRTNTSSGLNNHHRTRHSHRSSKHNNKRPDIAPFQTSINLEDTRDGQEIIEVQILPQDDNWGENTTAITGESWDNNKVEKQGIVLNFNNSIKEAFDI